MMGMDVTLVAPSMLMPENIDIFKVKTATKIDEIIETADVIYMLRMQFERQSRSYYPSISEYSRFLSLTLSRAKKTKQKAIIMHPGPVNRNIEIEESLFSDKNLKDKIKINEQVTNGVAVRMALLYFIFNPGGK
jgi:aspartate carbamoyltransferase catalytic subunit